MAGAHWRQNAAVAQQLHDQPYRFNFFQAVRLLEAMNHEHALHDATWGSFPVGHDFDPNKETVRFKPVPSMQFPSSQITELTQKRWVKGDEKAAEMLVTFMGLTGPAGVLPTHYTRMLMVQEHSRDHSLRDFLDMFNHRIISFFYRAWRKYRVYLDFERKRRVGRNDDHMSTMLRSYTGLIGESLQQRSAVPDDVLLFYAGLLSHRVHSASGLETMLSEYFQVQIKVAPLQNRMVGLHKSQWTQLPADDGSLGKFHQLGVNAVLGTRAPNSQNRFRLVVGPLSMKQFMDFLPDGTAMKPLIALVEMYVGKEFDFDIQLVLRRDTVPVCQLSKEYGPRLAWDAWLNSEKRVRDLDDIVLSVR